MYYLYRFATADLMNLDEVMSLKNVKHPRSDGTASGCPITTKQAKLLDDIISDPLYSVRSTSTPYYLHNNVSNNNIHIGGEEATSSAAQICGFKFIIVTSPTHYCSISRSCPGSECLISGLTNPLHGSRIEHYFPQHREMS